MSSKKSVTVTVTVQKESDETVSGGFLGLRKVPVWDAWCARVEVKDDRFRGMNFWAETEEAAVQKADRYVEELIKDASKPEPKVVRRVELDL